jgi:hypothetical protein
MIFGFDPDDPAGDTRVLVRDKANYAPASASALRLRIESLVVAGESDDGEPEEVPTSRSVEVGECRFTPAQVIAAGRHDEQSAGASKLDAALRFIETALADGPVPVDELAARAAEAGIAEHTFRRARQSLGVVVLGGGKRPREWAMPPEDPAI